MTVSSTVRKAGPYAGNDSATSFAFSFKVFAAGDLIVVRADSDGDETELVLDTDYTVALNADQDVSPGGTVALSGALATGYTMVISSELQNLQPTDLTNQGGFYPKVVSNALDRLTILIQQLAEKVARSLKVAITTPDGVSSQLPAPVPYALIGWNEDGTGFRNSDPSGAAGLLPDLVSTAAGKGDALVGVKLTASGSVARTQHDKNEETPSVEDFHGGGTDHTAAFIAACALGRHVRATGTSYSITGEIPMASGCRLEFTANPTITMDVSGENGRGFYFGPGVENAGVFGSATINVSASSLGSDGSRNGVFCFGSDYYVTSDPAAIRRCMVMGNFKIDCTGANNTKPVAIFGYVEDVLIHGVHATGQTNYAFFAHWVGNGGDGVLPTKTWHPHRLKFENCTAEDTASGTLLRAFTTSACGHVVFENCHSIDANTLGFNLFVGDYGFSYAQNINDSAAFDITLRDCSHAGTAPALSVDGASSRLNGSPYWTGASRHASLNIDSFLARMKAGTNAIDVAIAGLAHLVANELRIIEEADGNTQQAMYLTSIRNVAVQGEILAKGGVLIRDCGDVDYNINTRRVAETHDVLSYCVGVTALSETTTTTAVVSAGDVSVSIASAANVTGPGGILRYNDGTRDWEMDIESMTYAGAAQTLSISKAPVVIPSGATVTLIQTVKRLSVGPAVLQGARSLIRLSGTATAKPRNVSCFGTQFFRSGIADIEAAQVDGLVIDGTFHDHAGQTTTTTSVYCVFLGADAEGYRVEGARFGRNNTRVRYLVSCDNASKNGVICNNVFESINTGGSNPAAIFKQSAANVQIYGNAIVSTVPLIYPTTPTTYTIASDAITVEGRQYPTFMVVDTEAAAATDDLATINGGVDGQIIILGTSSSSRDVTVKDGTGNLILAGDFVLSNNQDTLTLIKRATSWYEVSRSDNAV